MRVRIVVPCYNEERRLPVADFDAYLSKTSDVGFVLVNDGSRDGTLEVLRAMAERWPGRVSVVDQQPNQGKAEAVRNGLREALQGHPRAAAFVGYWDADLATPLQAIDEFMKVMDDSPQVQLMLGARVALLGRAIERKPLRHYLGRLFATAASLTLGLAVYDTQCGAKLLRVSSGTLALFDKPFLSRWIFDVELIARYLEGTGTPAGLYELPLQQWRDVGESKVKPSDFLRAMLELLAIYRAHRGHRARRALPA